MTVFRYPCTGKVRANLFGTYLEENLKDSRHNLSVFSQELGNLFSAPYITLVNSGSSANLIAAMVLAEKLQIMGKPLEAVAAAYTFPTTLSSLRMAGFNVRLIDTEEGGFNLCPIALGRQLAEKPATLVCVTHFLGFAAQIEKIMALARANGAYVLQDACETMGMKTADGNPMHTLGDITTWSFYHPHHLSAYGGGAVLSSTPELYRIADSISHWGRACTCHIDPTTCTAPQGAGHNFTYVRTGVNVEMSELNACFGRFQLQTWEKIEADRKARYDILYRSLENVKNIHIYAADHKQSSPFVFPISCLNEADADDAIKRLGECGIECRTLMGGAMTEQPAFMSLAHDGNPNARALSRRSFFVGIHQTLPSEDVLEMAKILRLTLSMYDRLRS
jgi:CDP-6-deoxy-D-xylo-4-hexulose-3-dehydrase